MGDERQDEPLDRVLHRIVVITTLLINIQHAGLHEMLKGTADDLATVLGYLGSELVNASTPKDPE